MVPDWFTAAQKDPEAKHALESMVNDCEHIHIMRRIRYELSCELTERWQQTSRWRLLERAKLEGGIDALDELTERLSG